MATDFKDAEDADQSCRHYDRSCYPIAMCCGQPYACRLCHDENEDHKMDRFATQTMLCAECGEINPTSKFCPDCGNCGGKYYCKICKLWENDPRVSIFHCKDCGICRRGVQENFVHCTKCACCVQKSYHEEHGCGSISLSNNCVICEKDLFSSQIPTAFCNADKAHAGVHVLCALVRWGEESITFGDTISLAKCPSCEFDEKCVAAFHDIDGSGELILPPREHHRYVQALHEIKRQIMEDEFFARIIDNRQKIIKVGSNGHRTSLKHSDLDVVVLINARKVREEISSIERLKAFFREILRRWKQMFGGKIKVLALKMKMDGARIDLLPGFEFSAQRETQQRHVMARIEADLEARPRNVSESEVIRLWSTSLSKQINSYFVNYFRGEEHDFARMCARVMKQWIRVYAKEANFRSRSFVMEILTWYILDENRDLFKKAHVSDFLKKMFAVLSSEEGWCFLPQESYESRAVENRHPLYLLTNPVNVFHDISNDISEGNMRKLKRSAKESFQKMVSMERHEIDVDQVMGEFFR